jgi:hypothetical protein
MGFYYNIGNLALWTRSEKDGSACTNQPEYWSNGVLECWFLKQRKSALKLQSLSGMWLTKAMKKQVSSITPSLHYSNTP